MTDKPLTPASDKDFRNFNTVSYRAGQNAEAQAAMLAAALAKLKDAYEGRMGDAENADWYDEFNEAVAALTPSARAAGELWRAYEKLDEAARAECCERMFPDADMPILFEALQAIEAARKELEK